MLENDGLVKYCVRKYALELTGYGRTSFAGLGPADLFDELIGAAYEGALIAAENLDARKKNFSLPAYLRGGVFRYMKREAEDLLKQRGGDENALSLDAFKIGFKDGDHGGSRGLDALAVQSENPYFEHRLADIDDGFAPSTEDTYFADQVEDEVSVKAYVEQLLMSGLTESERRLANVIIKGDKSERIPFFSSTFASLRDKLIKRAAWMQAEGFGVPAGWGNTIARRVEQRAKEWAESE